MEIKNARVLWQAVQGELQIIIPKPSYETWIKDTRALSFNGNILSIEVPNAFVAEMLEHRMHSMISDAAEKINGSQIEVLFSPVVLENSDMSDVNDKADILESSISNEKSLHLGKIKKFSVNYRYSFETFIVGKSNELAHAASLAVSNKPGQLYNPLFIHSGVGLGKTHLVHSIYHILSKNGLNPVFSTTEDFTNEYISSIREGKTDSFRDFYRNADAILLDDIQFIIGKDQTQEGFFHTFNAIHLAGKQIVISSDRSIYSLKAMDDRITSRLSGGLVVDIQPPEYETRLSILQSKISQSGIVFPDDAVQFMANHGFRSVRELEGCLNRVIAYVEIVNSEISVDLVRSITSDLIRTRRIDSISETSILEAVAKYFAIERDSIKGRQRDRITAHARQITMFLLREETNLPLSSIGKFLGGKDHSTVLHACNRISLKINSDSVLRNDLINIRQNFEYQPA